jgi:DNA repair protein RecO (recombination protein O)
LKFLSALGYKPELYNCLGCSKRLEPTDNYFSASRGGVFCPACSKKEHQPEKLDETSVKIMRLALSHTLNDLANLRAEEKDWQRVSGAVNNLLNFNIHS